jgi:hypothetical protein
MTQVFGISHLVDCLKTLPWGSNFEGTDAGTVVVYHNGNKIAEYVCATVPPE